MHYQNILVKRTFLLIAGLIILISRCQKSEAQCHDSLKLWYEHPANATVKDNKSGWKDDVEWLRALPLGNGSLGAMVFGDVGKERIQLNEESMWSGGPYDSNNPEAYSALAEIRKLLFQGDYRAANELTRHTQICKGAGSGQGNGADVPFGCYQTLGDLWLDFGTTGEYENYYRELNMEDAQVNVSYTCAGVHYKRSVFVSYPDQLLVVRLTASKPGMISFSCSMTRPERFETKCEDNQLVMYGSLINGQGRDGVEYMTRLQALNKNGKVTCTDSCLTVQGADEVTLLLSAATDYVMQYPEFSGRPYQAITKERLQRVSTHSYAELLAAHKRDFYQYFNRVTLRIGGSVADTLPTDVRLERFREGTMDSHLVELMFQYGRYLLISSSRPGALPANLQGIWANKIQTPWNGDYHTDVNVQMNYWLAETTNLSEMHEPLFDLMSMLQQPGSQTARIHYHAAGWVVHPITNIWGFTAPGEASSWGMHVGAGAWLATHIMEHYYFSYDTTFLRRMYPVLKGAVQFYMDWLVPHPVTGELISGPSVSPENTFVAPDGSKSQICMGPSHDHQVISALFQHYIDASGVMGIKDTLLVDVMEAQRQLAQPKVGADGRLMEWYEEFEETEPGHRHISHLFALHPGHQIDIQYTPVLAAAAKKSLDYRISHGGGHTGWSAAWLISQYARLQDAEDAVNSLYAVLNRCTADNLFGLHPPFQMDANFGVTAGIAEMLLQHPPGELRLLPALPVAWADGEVKGLCGRGGFVVDMQWQQGLLTSVIIHSKRGGECKLSYRNQNLTFATDKDTVYVIKIEKGSLVGILKATSQK